MSNPNNMSNNLVNPNSGNLESTNQGAKGFLIYWEAKSEWFEENQKEIMSGESILVPIQISKTEGKIIRSIGYTEAIQVISFYKLLDDGTLIIHSDYNDSITEERIWFLSDNVRSRSSVTKSTNSLSILQTSYASEIRIIKT